VKFTIEGKEMTLEPVVEDPNDPMLWFIFKDATSAKETYGGGRFLYADMPKDGNRQPVSGARQRAGGASRREGARWL